MLCFFYVAKGQLTCFGGHRLDFKAIASCESIIIIILIILLPGERVPFSVCDFSTECPKTLCRVSLPRV